MIEGRWVLVEAELAGERMPGAATGATLVLEDGTYRFRGDRGEVRLGTSADHATMDVIGVDGPNRGKTFLAIYELEDDLLRICYDLEGRRRPTAFETRAGTRRFLATYRREPA